MNNIEKEFKITTRQENNKLPNRKQAIYMKKITKSEIEKLNMK